jgi:hypothetical protein
LQVSFDRVDDKFTNVILSGPALKSFEGEIEI